MGVPMTAKKSVPYDKFCECGCNLRLGGNHSVNGRWIRGHEDKMCELIRAGEAAPPFTITCQFSECGLENVPALGRGQKYCTERLTGRTCQRQAKDHNRWAKAKSGLNQLRGRLAKVAKATTPKYKYPFDRVKECLKDIEGRWCECVGNAQCLELVATGRLPKLQEHINAGIAKHCYQASTVSNGLKGMSGSGYGGSFKHTGPRQGCE